MPLPWNGNYITRWTRQTNDWREYNRVEVFLRGNNWRKLQLQPQWDFSSTPTHAQQCCGCCFYWLANWVCSGFCLASPVSTSAWANVACPIPDSTGSSSSCLPASKRASTRPRACLTQSLYSRRHLRQQSKPNAQTTTSTTFARFI